MKRGIQITGVLIMTVMMAAAAVSCGPAQENDILAKADKDISRELVFDHRMETEYADQYAIDYYGNGYALISVSDGSRFLVVPENKEAPEDLDEDIVVLQQPVTNIYLAATAVMDMFVSAEALEAVRLSGTEAEGWYIPAAKEAMEAGKIVYAGKYSAPDYELILDENCGLAIESTMILHAPEVKEKLESFGIPVFVDRSSYEEHPLGRVEWVKVYGVLTGQEEAAEQAFLAQKEILDEVLKEQPEGQGENDTVAFFYITANGAVSVKKSGDYVPKMIELAGGQYVFDDLGSEEENASSSMTMQMEEFYAGAKDADYLIYNSTVEGELDSLTDLLDQSALLKEFKAVKQGNVWCTTENLYQNSMELGDVIRDFHLIINGNEEEEPVYLYHLQ